MPTHLAAFVATITLLAVLPGANNLAVTRQTVLGGRRAGLLAVAGASTGILIWAVAAAAGVSALLLANPHAYLAIRLAGAAVLILLGIQSLLTLNDPLPSPATLDDPAPGTATLNDPLPAPASPHARHNLGAEAPTARPGHRNVAAEATASRQGWRSFVVGVAASLGNPKAGVVAVSLIPQFVTADGPVVLSSIALGAIWAAVSGTWFCLYVVVLDRGRARATSPAAQRLLRAATGVTLLGLGATVALTA
ncbi:LysE family translocator [Actinoplanes rectilineatus]|uniref:LysE family translocator n=1 Tax=Actinoplanes rectilineatus TaxID=113571 RepID=UPI0005F2CE2A|nr:LysE family translocator [Actinoplanes rectilineatus]